MSLGSIIFLFAVTCFICILLTKAAIPVLQKLGFWNAPDSEHKNRVVRGGGSAIAVTGFLCAYGFIAVTGLFPYSIMNSFIPATMLLLATGLIDDRFGIAPRYKLVLQIISIALLYIYGYKIENLMGWHPSRGMSFLLTLFWGVAILNAANLIDGLDGLCTGSGLIAGIAFMIIGCLTGNPVIIFFTTLLIAECTGFLFYNFHPAKLFLGDTGSLLLGLICTALSLKVTQGNFSFTNLLVMLMIFWIPFCDLGLAVWRRRVKSFLLNHHGKTMQRDMFHLHYRLLNVTNHHVRTVLIIFMGMIVIDVFAIWMFILQSIWFSILIFAVLSLISLLFFARYELQYTFLMLKYFNHCFRKRYCR